MSKALVTDIQRFSVHDGPGIRTTVFLKGCPLRCEWCHNPECISFDKETMYYPDKCIGCGRCAEGCFSGAKIICGREMSVDEVLKEVLLDKAYYGENGGVTVSGGDPLAHREFTLELLRACRKHGVGTAMESCMYRFDEEILSELDVLMTDIKVFDNDAHIRYTGVPNTEVLSNIRKADEMGVPIILRTPIVPTVNDSVENIKLCADFARSLKNVLKYELLPYHPLGVSKAIALGRKATEFVTPTKEQMKELNKYADIQG